MAFLRLIRWPNLLMIALTLCSVHYGLFKSAHFPVALNDARFALLVLATLLIAAGGYIINDVFDQSTDAINRPDRVIIGRHISEKTAYNLYGGFTITAAIIGYYLADYVGHTNFVGVFILSAAVLYLYASSFKQSLLIGNVLVSLLTGIVVLVPVVFDLVPVIVPETRESLTTLARICFDYAVFSFVISLAREITKDLEDVEGDAKTGMNTTPIAFGIHTTRIIVFVIAALAVGTLLWYIFEYFVTSSLWFVTAFLLLGAVGPLLFVLLRIFRASSPGEFRTLSTALKIVLLAGVFSISVVSLNILFNAKG
ncbi:MULTISPECIES: geranylgeranylglycerol-phosphate geranylgeranyltransferase [unclassified Flavobacterium]|uniref:geranylgeranylglycerol-phosphate geranylgeranyltransferase n=1 Tax=unclassified Flavobacterium TaxID=196869 RepID=UPI001F148756|nr:MULTISPECIES: geranylgeranylglycerol-phosphate geranylgeranyltransferase [unclassified Flavobacterium]UMY65216.1 geranylgeranylglycerol-phosphate geranylgeranyltransferase [Flavobacterium sp. HJ-32-4]